MVESVERELERLKRELEELKRALLNFGVCPKCGSGLIKKREGNVLVVKCSSPKCGFTYMGESCEERDYQV